MFNFSTQFYEGRYVPTKVIKLSTCFVVLMGTKNDQPRSLSLHRHRRIRHFCPWPSLHRHRVGLKRSEVGLDGHRTNDLSTSIYLGFRSLGSFSPLPPTLMTWTDFFWGRIWTCNLFHCVALVRYSRCSWHLVKLFKRCLMYMAVYLGTWPVQVFPSSGWGASKPQMVALLVSLFGAQAKC